MTRQEYEDIVRIVQAAARLCDIHVAPVSFVPTHYQTNYGEIAMYPVGKTGGKFYHRAIHSPRDYVTVKFQTQDEAMRALADYYEELKAIENK